MSSTQQAPSIGAIGMMRWAWRQLTSMRTALILLFLLAVASVPGSIIPQRSVDPIQVSELERTDPTLYAWYERLGLFDVFGSFWFGAIYLLLMISLLGCILPRTVQQLRVVRSRPPSAPRRLERMQEFRTWRTEVPAAEVLAGGRKVLRGYRVVTDEGEATDRAGRSRRASPAAPGAAAAPAGWESYASSAEVSGTPDGPDSAAERETPADDTDPAQEPASSDEPTTSARVRAGSLAAERGHAREWGNLLFHVALTVVLIGVAIGSIFGFSGTSIVVAGQGFANTVTQYDGYTSGRYFDPNSLTPFALTVDDFEAEFQPSGAMRGAAREFHAEVTLTRAPGAEPEQHDLRVNQPLRVGGADVHLLSHGYAPRFTVTDGNGEVAYSGPTVFLQQDANFSSKGVVKAPDAGPEQLGFEGFFLPTATVGERTGPISVFPDALRPEVFLTAYHGDLGMNSGAPQSVYRLEKGDLEQFRQDGGPLSFRLGVGESYQLPDGAGTITFEGYDRWVNMQVSSDPGRSIVLAGAVVALTGLLLSLVVRRRRVWIRVGEADGRTTVELAGLDRNEGGDLDEEIESLAERLRVIAPEVQGQPTDDESGHPDDRTQQTGDEHAERASGAPTAKEVEA